MQFWDSFYLEISMGTTIEISRGFVQIFEHIFVIEIFLYDFFKMKKWIFYYIGCVWRSEGWRFMVGCGHAGRGAGWPLCFYVSFRNLIERKIYEIMILGYMEEEEGGLEPSRVFIEGKFWKKRDFWISKWIPYRLFNLDEFAPFLSYDHVSWCK